MYIHLGTRMGMRHHGWFSGGNDPSKGPRRRHMGDHCRKVSALHTGYKDVENNTYLFSIRQVKETM